MEIKINLYEFNPETLISRADSEASITLKPIPKGATVVGGHPLLIDVDGVQYIINAYQLVKALEAMK